jgi:hypothetical protein
LALDCPAGVADDGRTPVSWREARQALPFLISGYDNTDLIVSELMEWGYGSDRGKRALRRMNQLHGWFDIANDDFLYVLSTFIYEGRPGFALSGNRERPAKGGRRALPGSAGHLTMPTHLNNFEMVGGHLSWIPGRRVVPIPRRHRSRRSSAGPGTASGAESLAV